MARMIAIDWDRIEARIVVAKQRSGGVAVEQAVAVPLNLPPAQDNATDGLSEELGKALASVRASKSPVLSAVGRSLVELRTMSLPPAPDEELPDMVRFQAMREFSSLKESSPLDFTKLGSAGQEDGEVVAASIPSELHQEIQKAITEQGHESLRCVMRPASAASLALRQLPACKSGVTLVIGQQADSAELSVTNNGTVVFTRSFRLPPNWHPGTTGQPLLGEVRRTLAAAQNQLGGSRVERIVLFGTPQEHGGLQSHLADATSLPVEVLNPLDDVVVAGATPDRPERFAALIGMLKDEADEVAPAIDFQNPRKRPEPESNRRQYTLYAMTAATVLLGLVFLWWWKHQALSTDIAEARWQVRMKDEENRKLRKYLELAKQLDDWKKGDKNWLDELTHISVAEGVNSDDFKLQSLVATTGPDGRGSLTLSGRAKNNDSYEKFKFALVDDKHSVEPGSSEENPRQDERYPVQFNAKILSNDFMGLDPPQPANKSAAGTDNATSDTDESNEQVKS